MSEASMDDVLALEREFAKPTTAIISIGRNVGSKPMPETIWKNFQAAVIDIGVEIGQSVFAGVGVGDYESNFEESFTLVLAINPWLKGRLLNVTRWHLAELARSYGQDSIAFTLGETEFLR